jgi:hypothetical protein
MTPTQTRMELAIALHVVNEVTRTGWRLSVPSSKERLLRCLLRGRPLIVIFTRPGCWHTQSVLLVPGSGREIIAKYSRGYRAFQEAMERAVAIARGDILPHNPKENQQ